MIRVYADTTCLIVLGRLGENDHTCVVFAKSVQELLKQYPNATIGLYYRPARSDQSYPVAATQRVGDTLEWTVQSAELAEEGRGQCELVARENGTIAKSIIFITSVSPALTGSATPPTPWEEWMAEFIRLKGEAEAAAEDAEEAASHYPKIDDGVWYVWDVTAGEYVSTGIEAQGPKGDTGAVYTPAVSAEGVISWTNNGGLPNPESRNIKGAQGDPGISPAVSVEPITGGHRITITDATHPQGITVDVMDGVNGQDGRGIVSIEKTATSGLVDTYTITYTTGSPTTFTVTNGADGVNAYVHIKYAQQQPTQDSDMSGTPGPWMGVYSGTSATAPTHYTDYVWNEVKGPQGDAYILTAADKQEIAGIAANELQPSIAELNERKADKNGNYPNLTAGYADQLITDVGPTDKVPYLLRPSGGGVTVGDREIDKIIGGTVGWNQLVDENTEAVTLTSGHRYAACIGGVWSIGTSNGTAISVTGGTDQVFDLSVMFGSTIANYINTLETATPGAGVAWFRALFPKDYYAYDAGTLRSVQTSAHVMRDADNAIIGNYPLDSSLELRGIPRLDANNRLYYYGDEYESDGTVTRRYEKITLNGSERWFANNPGSDRTYFYYEFKPFGYVSSRCISDTYLNVSITGSTTDIGFTVINSSGRNSAVVYIRPANVARMTVAEFKDKLAANPVTIVYGIAAPTTESAAPYQNPQYVDDFGTEQYIDAGDRDVEIPVGHETFYPENLRKKIEGLPWDFSNLIGPTEKTLVATRPYAAGDLFIVNNMLYRATVSIANGATITPGTNCEQTTLAAIIATLN